jgi:hypothetical protein
MARSVDESSRFNQVSTLLATWRGGGGRCVKTLGAIPEAAQVIEGKSPQLA